MTKYNQIYLDAEKYAMDLAAKSPLRDFFGLHLPEVVLSAQQLLAKYKEADSDVVIIAAWLHDLGHFKAKTLADVDLVKPNHHIVGAEMAEDFLRQYNLPKEMLEKIKRAILCHRGSEPYSPETIEEKIVTVSDTLSHFQSIFFLVYFKIYPNDDFGTYVANQKSKLARDWRDLALLPEGREIARPRYEMIMSMLNDYKK